MRIKYSRHQRGVVTVLVAITLPILLFIIGMAVDFGHVFVNKTRLQNALDASALSAAIAINADVTHNVAAATAKGIATFKLFIATTGNNELANLNAEALVFDYSKTLYPWGTFNQATDKFAFVRVTSTDMLNVTPILIKISEQFKNNIPVPAIATAGPAGNNCSLTPFVLCANMSPLDKDCSDNNCYGYTVGQKYNLIVACNGNVNQCDTAISLEAGNFNLLNLDGLKGGKDIRNALSAQGGDPGYRNTCELNTLDTKPGYTAGNVKKGIDNRFDSDTDTLSSSYTQYETNKNGNNRRIMAAPIGDCSALKNKPSDPIPKVGAGCVFLTQHAANNGKEVYAEFISSCQQSGLWNPENPVLNGPYKIVIFKSPGSSDS